MSSGLAAYYSDAVSDTTKRGLEQKLRNGEWIGRPKLGYQVIKGIKKNHQDIDSDQAAYIKRLFELYSSSNYSVKTVGEAMYQEGFKSNVGKRISNSQIHKLLREKFYIGIMVVKGKEYRHKYPRIIDKSLFDQVQTVLDNRNKKPTKYASKPFIFRGLITCEKCGGTISGDIKKGKYIYYMCSNFKGICNRKGIREEKLLEPIHEILKNLQLSQRMIDFIVKGLKDTHNDKQEYHNHIISQLHKEYTEIQRKKDNLVNLLIDARITQDIYDKKMHEFELRQQEINLLQEEHTQAD